MEVSPINMNSTNMASDSKKSNNAVSNSINMNKDMYMTLFLETLKNQTPENTMDNAQMMQQMSQLGFMEQVENMKFAIEDLKEMQEGQQLQNASSMLGRTVVAMNSDNEKIVGQINALRMKDGSVQYLVNNQIVTAPQIMEVGLADKLVQQNYEQVTQQGNNLEGNTKETTNEVSRQEKVATLSPLTVLEKEKAQIEQSLKAI